MGFAAILPKSRKSNELGAQVENLAEKWLRKKGLKLLHKNFRCKCGEIDLIMLDKNTIAFIEVRLRTNKSFATGAETVTYQKQQKIINTANYYLQRNTKMIERPIRFDVISVSRKQTGTIDIGSSGIKNADTKKSSHADFDWIVNAFEVSY